MKEQLKTILRDALDDESFYKIIDNFDKFKDMELIDIGIDSIAYVAILAELDEDAYIKLSDMDRITLEEVNNII